MPTPANFEVDFNIFSDNHPMPDTFSQGGFTFMNRGAPGALFVNETLNERGLVVPPAGLLVKMPVDLHFVQIRFGTFAGPAIFEWLDQNQSSLGTSNLDFNNSFQDFAVTSFVPARYVRFTQGGNESMLRRIRIELNICEYEGALNEKDNGIKMM